MNISSGPQCRYTSNALAEIPLLLEKRVQDVILTNELKNSYHSVELVKQCTLLWYVYFLCARTPPNLIQNPFEDIMGKDYQNLEINILTGCCYKSVGRVFF